MGVAVPLTTPIYTTTTFVFDSADEVVAYNEGRSAKYLYSRYANPTVGSAAIYGGTLHLLQDVLANFGVSPRFVSLEELADPEYLFTDRTKLVWFESPTNPTLR